MNSIDLVGFFMPLLALALVGWKRSSSADDYTVAARNLGLFPLVATLVMTEFNTSTLMAFAAVGYNVGPLGLALPAVFLFGLSFYTVTVARPWKRFNRLSVAELFSERYSRRFGKTASALLLTAMAGFTATYVKSLTLLFVPFAPAAIPVSALAAILTLVVVLAVLPGGLASIVRADVLGFVATLILFPVLLLLGRWRGGDLASVFPASQLIVNPLVQWNHPALSMRFVSTLVVLTCFTYIAAPWYGQKIFAAKNSHTAFRAVALSAVLVFTLYGMVVLAAAFLRTTHPSLPDAQLALPMMVREWLPVGARGMGFAVLFAAAFTTLSGVWSAMATMLAADLLGPRWASINGQRRLLLVLALLSWTGGSFLVDDILNRLILANIPVAALAFALLAGFHWPRATTVGAWASMVVGVVWGIGCFLYVGEAGGYTWPWAMYGIPLIFGTGVTASLLTSRSTSSS